MFWPLRALKNSNVLTSLKSSVLSPVITLNGAAAKPAPKSTTSSATSIPTLVIKLGFLIAPAAKSAVSKTTGLIFSAPPEASPGLGAPPPTPASDPTILSKKLFSVPSSLRLDFISKSNSLKFFVRSAPVSSIMFLSKRKPDSLSFSFWLYFISILLKSSWSSTVNWFVSLIKRLAKSGLIVETYLTKSLVIGTSA